MRAESKLDLITAIIDSDDDGYDLREQIIIKELKEVIGFLSDPKNDPFETPDNIAMTLSSFYCVLSYYLTTPEYEAFVKGMRVK